LVFGEKKVKRIRELLEKGASLRGKERVCKWKIKHNKEV
jgi:hypothetical protein